MRTRGMGWGEREREGKSRHITGPACGSHSQIVSNPCAQSTFLTGEGEGASSQPSVPTTRALVQTLGQGVRGRECIFHFLAFVWSAESMGFCLYLHVLD